MERVIARRRPALHGTVVILAIVLAACGGGPSPSPHAGASGPPGDGDRPLFVAILASTDDAEAATGFAAEVEARGGIAQVVDARRDPRLTVTLLGDAIEAGAAGVSVTAPDASIGGAVARLAAAAGIPLVATRASLSDDGGLPVPFVGTDDRQLGEAVGSEAARLLADAGWDGTRAGVLSLEVQTTGSCAARAEGQRAALLAAGIPVANVVAVAYDGTAVSAAAAALPLVVGRPQLTHWVVVGCDDQGVRGGLDALAAATVDPADIIGVGLGADEACRDWARGIETGFRSALFLYGGEVGAAAARVLWDAARRGVPLPERTIVQGTIVTPDGYEDVVPASFADACAAPATP